MIIPHITPLFFPVIARVLCSEVFGESDFIIVKIVSMNFVENLRQFTKKERNVENVENTVEQLKLKIQIEETTFTNKDTLYSLAQRQNFH